MRRTPIFVALVVMIFLASAVSFAYAFSKGDASFSLAYDVAEPIVLANGTVIQYTPECFETCWLPIEVQYSGTLALSTKSLKNTDIKSIFVDVENKLKRTMSVEYYYLSYETATTSTWTLDKDCTEVLENKTVIELCQKGSIVNETKTGWFLRPLTEVILTKDTPKIIVMKGTGSAIFGSAVDIVPNIFGFDLIELAVWNATWTLGSPSAMVEMMGLQMETHSNFDSATYQCFEGVRRDPALTLLNACQLWNQTDTGSITNLVNGTFSGDWCNFTSAYQLQPSEYYFVTTSASGGNRHLSASIFCSGAGCGTSEIDTGFYFNFTGGVFYTGGAWYNDNHNTGVTQAFNLYNFSFVECGGTPTTTNLYIDGTMSNQTYGFNPSRVVNLTGIVDQDVWVAIDINGTMVANDTSEGGHVEYNFTDFGGGIYNVTAYFDGDGFFEASSETFWITIQPNPTSIMEYINGTSGIWNSSYPNSTLNLTAVANETIPVSIQRNGTVICSGTPSCFNITQYGVGWYNFTANFSGNENYSASSKTWFANISKGNNPLVLSNNGSWSITFPSVATITGSGNVTPAYLYRNTSLVSNPYSTPLGAGAYNFVWNTSGNANYSLNSTANTLTIAKADPDLDIEFNETSPIIQGEPFWVNCTSGVGLPVNLSYDYGYIPNPLIVNNTTTWLGLYNFSCNTTGNENYTAYIENETIEFVLYNLLDIDVYDEQDQDDVTFNITLENTTFTHTEYDLEVFSANATNTPFGDITIKYWNSDRPERKRFMYLEEDDEEDIDLYSLLLSEGQYVSFEVTDYGGDPLENALVQAWTLIDNETLIADEEKTDSSGVATLFLDYEDLYYISIQYGGTWYVTNSSLIPSQTFYHYFINPVNYTNYSTPFTNMYIEILPSGLGLNKSVEDQEISFTAISSGSDLLFYGYNFTLPNGTSYTNNTSSSTGGTVSKVFNLSQLYSNDQTNITSFFFFQKNGTYDQVNFTLTYWLYDLDYNVTGLAEAVQEAQALDFSVVALAMISLIISGILGGFIGRFNSFAGGIICITMLGFLWLYLGLFQVALLQFAGIYVLVIITTSAIVYLRSGV